MGWVEKSRHVLGIERLEAGLGRAVDEGAGQAGRIGLAVVRPRLEDRLDSRVGDAVRTSEGRSATLQRHRLEFRRALFVRTTRLDGGRAVDTQRLDERCVGQESVRTCRSWRWSASSTTTSNITFY